LNSRKKIFSLFADSERLFYADSKYMKLLWAKLLKFFRLGFLSLDKVRVRVRLV
jgi:hypothetical protein